MKIYGLIGKKLGHSFSKEFFTSKFKNEGLTDHQYELFELTKINELKRLLNQQPGLRGLNVTIPYKQEVLSFISKIDDAARAIGAVNTIKIKQDLLLGFNTDAYGFEKSLFETIQPSKVKRALVLGSGGASKAIQYVLTKSRIPFTIISRNEADGIISYNNPSLSEYFRNASLIINTTPLGMYPNVSEFPQLPYHLTTKNHIFFDLVYNPEITTFLAEGKRHGALIKNGLDMLYYQADRAWEIWNDNTL